MKQLFFSISLMALYLLTDAQSNNIVIGTVDTIHSKVLSEKRPVLIYKPDNGVDGNDVQKKYPVIYLLDGDWHFVSVVGMIQQLSYINGNTVCPEMIVVGIPIEDRFRDLTPSCDTTISKTSGGFDKFIYFIKDELIPYIEKNYPVAPYDIFIGHSLGGLSVINTLVKYPKLFNAYIAIDPSMWWNNQASLVETKNALSRNTFDNITLFLAIANSMDSGMDTLKVRDDRTRNTLPIRSNLELSDALKSNSSNQLNYKVKYYDNENHASVPLISTYDALHFIFNFYNLPLTKKDYADSTMSLAYRIVNHYKYISGKMGYTIKPSENQINTLAYNALYMNNNELAEYFFKLNIDNYPGSYNVYDSMGDYYSAVGNNKQAVKMYKKALQIHEIPDTKEKLNKIEKKE